MNYQNEYQQRAAPIKRRFGDCFVGEPPKHDFKRLNTGGSREACPTTGSTGMKRRFGVVDSFSLACDGACPRPRKCPRLIGFTTIVSSGGSSSLPPPPPPPPPTSFYPRPHYVPSFSSSSSSSSARSRSLPSWLSSSRSSYSFRSHASNSSSSPSSASSGLGDAVVPGSSHFYGLDNAVVPGGSRLLHTVVYDPFDAVVLTTGSSSSFWSSSSNYKDAVSLWIEDSLLSMFQEEDSNVPQID